MQSYTISSKLKFTFNPDNEHLQALLAHHKRVWFFGIGNMHELMKVIIVNWLWDKTTVVHGKTFAELEIVVEDEREEEINYPQ